MSTQGWYDADGNFHKGPPPQVKPVEQEPEPEPAGWYDAEGSFHEGVPPGLAAKRAEEQRLAAAAAPPTPAGWYDADGNFHHGPPPGLAQQVANAPVSQADSQPVQPVAQTPEPQLAPAAVTAQRAKASGGAKVTLIVLLLALVASLTALAMSLMGMFSLSNLGLQGAAVAGGASGAPAPQLVLVPANQAGYSSWRIKPVSEQNGIPPEVLAKSLSGEVAVEPVQAAFAGVAGDRADSYGVTNQSCQNAALREVFTAEPARGEAWVDALNSDEKLGWSGELKLADVRAFTDNLTVGVLLADTAVTAHGYVMGAAFPSQTVLQAGTLVGIDRFGVPRVRCVSGEPLTAAPEFGGGLVQFTGQQWQGFDAAKVVTVAPAASALDSFDVRFVGAANVAGGSIAPGWQLCDRGACPAPGPDARAPENSTVPPAGTVSAESPAQCSSVNDAQQYVFRLYNLGDKPVVLSWVDPATCQTFPGNNDWNAILGPGQLFQSEGGEGQMIQIGNGTDPGALDTITITESLIYGIK